MERCNYNSCGENAWFLLASAAAHLRVCGGHIAEAMRDEGIICATIVDLRKVL